MSRRTREREDETEDTSEDDDQVELRDSQHRKRQHRPDAYTVGYDPAGETRVGTGNVQPGSRIERLLRHNDGRHNSDGMHSTREAARDKKRITQSFCSVLGLTPLQQRSAVSAISQLNLDKFGRQKRLEKVSLGVIRFVVDQDRQRIYFGGDDPTDLDLGSIDLSDYPDSLKTEEEFQELCENFELSSSDLYSISQLVKRELGRVGYFEDSVPEEM